MKYYQLAQFQFHKYNWGPYLRHPLVCVQACIIPSVKNRFTHTTSCFSARTNIVKVKASRSCFLSVGWDRESMVKVFCKLGESRGTAESAVTRVEKQNWNKTGRLNVLYTFLMQRQASVMTHARFSAPRYEVCQQWVPQEEFKFHFCILCSACIFGIKLVYGVFSASALLGFHHFLFKTFRSSFYPLWCWWYLLWGFGMVSVSLISPIILNLYVMLDVLCIPGVAFELLTIGVQFGIVWAWFLDWRNM